MPLIEPARGLEDYLAAEAKATEESRQHWNVEFSLFSQLAGLYSRLVAMARISRSEIKISAELFLVVESQMYGVISQLLRRRVKDAESLTRKAIESTAVAHLIWQRPELIHVYMNAYPNSDRTNDPNQWRPSRDYQDQFSTRNLFSESGDTWDRLQVAYSLTSAFSTHAGPGALTDHETRGTVRYLPFLEDDIQNITRHWYFLLGVYLDLLKVFIRILRETTEDHLVTTLAHDIESFEQNVSEQKQVRAPFMTENRVR